MEINRNWHRKLTTLTLSKCRNVSGIMFSHVLGTLHSRAARSHFALWCAVKIRNQCNAIIGRALGASVPHHHVNGEEKLSAALRGQLRYFVDVGANRGTWTGMFCKYQSNIDGGLLFEPSASAVAELQRRFDGDSRLEIIGAAVGDVQGEAVFYEEAEAGETSSLVIHHSTAKSIPRSVRLTTLDAELEGRNWPQIDFLKVDAEGYDFHVLRGAHSLLASRQIRIGQFEYGPGWRHAGSTLACALDFLSGLGYACLLLTCDGLSEPRYEWYGEYFEYSNYVFFRPDAQALITDLIR
jgi:FkbM family methyltransferase